MLFAASFLLLLSSTALAVDVPHIFTPLKEYSAEKCPEGFERLGHQCFRPEEIPSTEVCGKGTTENQGICYLSELPDCLCPEGQHSTEKTCEVTTTTTSDLVCPEGTVQENHKCVVGSTLTICPVGTARTPKGKCGKLVEKDLVCPDGTTPTAHGLCAASESTDPTYICPDGFDLIDGQCVVHVEYDKICPKGAADEGNQCAFFFPAEYQCAPGFTWQEGACVTVERSHLIPSCPAGGELIGGMCKKEEPYPETLVCPQGVLVDGTCINDVKYPVSYQCPPGYTLEDGKKGMSCVSNVTYDCSITKYECDPEKSKDLQVKAKKTNPADLIHQFPIPSHLRHLEGTDKLSEMADLLTHNYHPSIHEFHDYCYKVPVVIPKTCEKVATADPIPYCTEGVYDGKKHCIVQTTEPPLLKCEATINELGKCVLLESYHPVYECPEGFVQEHKECINKEYGPLEFFCPQGTEEFEGQCATFVDKECPKGGCEVDVTAPPQLICPVGYVLERDLHGRDDCVKTVYVFKQPVCPAGTTELSATTCGKLVSPINVDDESFVLPQIICPIGFFPQHGECISVTYRLAEPSCPPGFTRDNTICLKRVGAIETCPKGSHQKGGICYVELKVRPLQVVGPVMKSPKELPPLPEIPKIPYPEIPTIRVPSPTIPKGFNLKSKFIAPVVPKAHLITSAMSKMLPFGY